MDRRRFVAAVTAGMAALAGCSGGETTPSETPSEDTPRGTGTPTGSPTPTEEPTPADTPTPEETPTANPTRTPTPEGVDAIVEVGPAASLRFDPESVEVSTGATVRWVWRGSGHNVSPRSTPDGADWSGTPGSETFDEGYTYEHTFETAGTYGYACDPHESAGMTGEVVVSSDVGYDVA
jgi:plastocyanin